MATTIALLIINAEDRQPGQGKILYKKYFIDTTFYAKYRTSVDTILIAEGYERCIVA